MSLSRRSALHATGAAVAAVGRSGLTATAAWADGSAGAADAAEPQLVTCAIPVGAPVKTDSFNLIRNVEVDGVRVENFRVVNGTVIADSMRKPGWYLTTDFVPIHANEHVTNLKFLTTAEAESAAAS
ncbi:hypothetical protein ABZT51_49630 [Streptomyces sp. NPDC005373]|uniref:hypothetical protein n=1 Tax=Streptomyces sp. NPDC005373 TaxID=3156879 RepID=UPI0033A51101